MAESTHGRRRVTVAVAGAALAWLLAVANMIASGYRADANPGTTPTWQLWADWGFLALSSIALLTVGFVAIVAWSRASAPTAP